MSVAIVSGVGATLVGGVGETPVPILSTPVDKADFNCSHQYKVFTCNVYTNSIYISNL